MSFNLLKLVNEIIRESEIILDGEENEINQLTEHISEKIKGHVPGSLKVLTFATLRLRDIEDHTNWAKNIFPNAKPYYFVDEKSVKDHYDEHIRQLKTELPNVGFERKSATVVGALCEGLVGISMLEVRVVKSSVSVTVEEQNAKINITQDELKNNYNDTHDALLKLWADNPQYVDFAVYVTMLSMLLMKWDVVVITANNIKRIGIDNKSGLAGAIFCFERGSSDHDDFILNLPSFFSPILQLVANAALLESTRHHHGHNKHNIEALKKLRPFIDMIKTMEHDILKAVGGCFGDDLVRFFADLYFVSRKGSDSLYALFDVSGMSTKRQDGIGDSGIFHLKPEEYLSKRPEFHIWLNEKFPELYPHLDANKSFKERFIDKLLEVKDELTHRELFPEHSSDSPLKKLFLTVGNKYIFLTHIEAMISALNGDFSNTCTAEFGRDEAYVILTVADAKDVRMEDAVRYLKLAGAEDFLKANFARSQFHPQLWLRLYGGKVTIEWKNANSEVIASVDIVDIKSIATMLPLKWKAKEVAKSFVAKYEI